MKYELRTTNYRLNTSDERQATCDEFAPFCAFLWLKNPRNLRNPRLINDLRAFGIFTLVKKSLQISPFCTNKPNFRKVKLNVNNVLTKDYEQMDTWSIGKNKPNSNPIQSQFKANTNPIKPKTKPKQTQFQSQKMLLRYTINTRCKSLGYYTNEIEPSNACDRPVVGYRLPGAGTRGGFYLIVGAAWPIIDGLRLRIELFEAIICQIRICQNW
jgi:hypothetical protein